MDPIVKRVYPAGENLRIVEAGEQPAKQLRPRSHWQQRRDQDLDQIEEALRTARELIADAHEGMETRGLDPQHKQLPFHIEQELEDLKTYRYAQG